MHNRAGTLAIIKLYTYNYSHSMCTGASLALFNNKIMEHERFAALNFHGFHCYKEYCKTFLVNA